MPDSILNTTKKALGLPVEDTAFDVDILMQINTAVAVLTQLGVGPTTPLSVVDADTEWENLTTEPTVLSMVKTFIYLKTRMGFDPPGTSFLLDAMSKNLDELTWRIEIQANPYVPEEETTPPEYEL